MSVTKSVQNALIYNDFVENRLRVLQYVICVRLQMMMTITENCNFRSAIPCKYLTRVLSSSN